MEKKETLKDWLERRMDEDMKSLGFTRQTTPTHKSQQETTLTKGTITFPKGKSAKKAKACFQHQKGKQ